MSCAHPSPHLCGRQCEAWKAVVLLIGKCEDGHMPELEEGCILSEESPKE